MASWKTWPAHASFPKPAHHRRQRMYPRVEPLEDRCMPATFTPTTFADGGLFSGSLRDAILRTNADTGTATDTILLQAGTYTLTIQNTAGQDNTGVQGDLDITNTSHELIILGRGFSGSILTTIDASKLHDR